MTAPPWTTRLLQADDLHILRPLRLDALRLHPEAFGNSFEDESRAPPDELAARLLLPPTFMFGGFIDGRLAGMTGLLTSTRVKTRHKADVFGVYVDAAARRTGIAHALVQAAIACARDKGIILLHLTVSVGNEGARRVYAGLGFRSFAIEKRAYRVDGRFVDSEHMALNLDGHNG